MGSSGGLSGSSLNILGTVLIYLSIAIASYLIGSINFAKIIAWHGRRKDITKIGSKNPGTMNMLRSFGLWLAVLTFCCEVVKAGAICLLTKFLTSHFGLMFGGEFAYYFAGLFIVLGYDFPLWSKFKGGKGVAVFAGIFLFSQVWYVALGWFFICFVILILLDYGSVVSFLYTGGLTIATTIVTWLAMPGDLVTKIFITATIWFLYVLMLIKHRGNIKRLFNHTENKVGFKAKLKKVFHKKGEKIIDEENVEQSAEKEIVVDQAEQKESSEEILDENKKED